MRTCAARTAAALVLLAALGAPAAGQTWATGGGGDWDTAANWNPQTVPDAAGAAAVFNIAASPLNAAQSTQLRVVTLAGPRTVGSVTFNNDSDQPNNGFATRLTTASFGTLTFASGGAGPAAIGVPAGPGGGSNSIFVPIVLSSSVVATVGNESLNPAGALNLIGPISGAGGFTKAGSGLATFDSTAKTYTGPTAVTGGVLRVFSQATPTATAGLTVSGGQLALATSTSYSFGSAPVVLAGAGPAAGAYSATPGAVRTAPGVAAVVTNAVVLQSDTLLHAAAAPGTGLNTFPDGLLRLNGNVSGPGRLLFTAPNSSVDVGSYVLAGSNSYAGGTLVRGGRVTAFPGSTTAFGTGDVTVSDAGSPASVARAVILSGAANAVADTATLSLAGGGTAGVADENYLELDAGVNETVGRLVLGGVVQPPGTYGATGSGAANVFDEYFTGAGVVTVPVPEPAAVLLAAAGALTAARLARRRLE